MIEHIFISDDKRRLLLGANQTLSEYGFTNNILKKELDEALDLYTVNSNFDNEEPLKDDSNHDSYPIIYLDSSRIAQLRVNDILLNILYQDMDNFQAAKSLLDIKNLIEEKIITLDSKSVQKHYFWLLEHLCLPNLDLKPEFQNKQPTDNLYVDIVQNIHCMSQGETILINKIHGEAFLDNSYSDSLNILIHKKKPIVVKSTHKIEENREEIKIRCENIETPNLFSFYQKDLYLKYFKMKRNKNLITLESEYKGTFKYLEIIVPVGNLAYRAETQASGGKCEFDIKKSLIYWRFRDTVFKKETLKFNISALEMQENENPIIINFRIENADCCAFRLESVVNKSMPSQKIWVRNITQNGIYELYSK